MEDTIKKIVSDLLEYFKGDRVTIDTIWGQPYDKIIRTLSSEDFEYVKKLYEGYNVTPESLEQHSCVGKIKLSGEDILEVCLRGMTFAEYMGSDIYEDMGTRREQRMWDTKVHDTLDIENVYSLLERIVPQYAGYVEQVLKDGYRGIADQNVLEGLRLEFERFWLIPYEVGSFLTLNQYRISELIAAINEGLRVEEFKSRHEENRKREILETDGPPDYDMGPFFSFLEDSLTLEEHGKKILSIVEVLMGHFTPKNIVDKGIADKIRDMDVKNFLSGNGFDDDQYKKVWTDIIGKTAGGMTYWEVKAFMRKFGLIPMDFITCLKEGITIKEYHDRFYSEGEYAITGEKEADNVEQLFEDSYLAVADSTDGVRNMENVEKVIEELGRADAVHVEESEK